MNIRKMLAMGLLGGWYSVTLPQNLTSNTGTLFEDFETLGDWAISPAGCAVADTTNYLTGTQSIKLTPQSDSGVAQIVKNFPVNTFLPSTGCIHFNVFIEDITIGGVFRIYLYNGTGKYFQQGVTIGSASGTERFHQGWNIISMPVARFSQTGSPDWSLAFTKIEIHSESSAGVRKVISLDSMRVGVITIPAVILTFDDGFASQEIAQSYCFNKNIVGTSYVISNNIGSNNYLTSNQIQKMYVQGWDIGNHTRDHTALVSGGLTDPQIIAEFTDCTAALDALGCTRASLHAAQPFGAGEWSSDVEADAVTAGILSCRDDTVVSTAAHASLVLPFYHWLRWRRYYNGLTSSLSLATVKGYIDEAKIYGQLVNIQGHKIGASSDSLTWLDTDYYALVDYIRSQGVQSLTISELYRLQSGPINVNHH